MIDLKSAEIKLDGFAETEAEDIRRCLMTLYSVHVGEQPLDRDFGINYDFIDRPLPVAKNMCTLEVIEKTAKYEKRVSVRNVEYGFGINGRLIPTIFCERGDAL